MKPDDQDSRMTMDVAGYADMREFKRELRAAFAVAVAETFGDVPAEKIPSDEDIEESLRAPGAIVYHILSGGRKVGGAVICIDETTQKNSLDLFYVSKSEQGRGIGYKAWRAIETLHPQTRVWETCTPCFEKRNIHFYVNKCGFKIVEYFNRNNPDPHAPGEREPPGEWEFFRFEKAMRP
ncbi:GNAT family N-acetyltransferase [Rhodoblastus sphagnicola]|uniref:GNAT family N-acetyltransferase n=1 Tax=Rhodoblastus sphagnicola TaxID=333368 RepID=A0A2S6NFA3_9HYPH|nr:GNAT family N-acetyltransferase [Rhodoblastus sphagnicola]MBB4199816.1 GNAT superfamily N-acetyltransferase [Rhodoblastus sphagnicola]PPQ33301.1 GNAT family N-acetyltransferase [Rhodoblastus sphagnicola]